MLDHVGFAVADMQRSVAFYKEALTPLGITLLYEIAPEQSSGGSHAGFGSDGKAYFWIGDGKEPQGAAHIAFAAASREIVVAFYKAAIAAGGKDNGGPGLRPHYHANYYGAFVLDPDGYNIEAVCRLPE